LGIIHELASLSSILHDKNIIIPKYNCEKIIAMTNKLLSGLVRRSEDPKPNASFNQNQDSLSWWQAFTTR
jgi:hypothetical protein